LKSRKKQTRSEKERRKELKRIACKEDSRSKPEDRNNKISDKL